MSRPRLLLAFILSSVLIGSGTSPVAAQTCLGDCNGDGVVAINELITGVNIALASGVLDNCPSFDRDDDGSVQVNELIRAVTNLLTACPV